MIKPTLRKTFTACVLIAASACARKPGAHAPEPPQPEESDTLQVPEPVFEPEIQLDAAPLLERALRIVALSGHPETIRRLLELAGAIDPDHPYGFQVRAILAEQAQDWQRAVDAWAEVVRLSPANDLAMDRLAITTMRRDVQTNNNSSNEATNLIEDTPRSGPLLTTVAVGDIQLGMGWPEARRRLPPDDALPIFARIRDTLMTGDIVFGNLETVLADSGASTKCRTGSRNCFAFRAPTAHASTLRQSGFTVLSLNNNHSGDFGAHGRASTIAAVENADLLHSGPASGIASWESKGLRIALIAFSTGGGPYRVQNIETARAAVNEAEKFHDIVIVSFHGGAEGAGATRVPKQVERAFGENRGDVYAFAHALVDAGADLVLGHGPHVLRGVEIYRGRFIAYSLGNFSSWRTFSLRGNLGISAVLRVTFAINGVVTEADLVPVVLEDPGIPTLDGQRRAIEIVRRLSEADFGDPVFDTEGKYRRVQRQAPHP